MDSLLGRYRNITLLLLVVFAQLILLAVQVKNKSDVRMIRVWAVTAVTPIAQIVEGGRSSVSTFFGNYVSLKDVREEERKLRAQVDSLKLENQELRSELSLADRAKALSQFEARTPSKMLAARIIGNLNGATNKVAFIDRGSTAGVLKGMAVVTADGIAGRVLDSYPTASQIQMVDDPGFSAGVLSQKNHVRGILVGIGHGKCKIEYVQNEERVDVGELFFTSGDDRVFPKGMPAARVTAVSSGSTDKQIAADPLGVQNGADEVLVVLQGVHQAVPEAAPSPAVYIGPDTPPDAPSHPKDRSPSASPPRDPSLLTDADRLREKYRAVGEAQNHKFGEGTPGSIPPNFNLPAKLPAPKVEAPSDPAKPAPPKPETQRPGQVIP